jgi:hypothetical protein
MKQEQVLGIIRHVLTFVGGVLITKGLVDEVIAQEVIGGVMTLVGSVWSIFSKKTSQPQG